MYVWCGRIESARSEKSKNRKLCNLNWGERYWNSIINNNNNQAMATLMYLHWLCQLTHTFTTLHRVNILGPETNRYHINVSSWFEGLWWMMLCVYLIYSHLTWFCIWQSHTWCARSLSATQQWARSQFTHNTVINKLMCKQITLMWIMMMNNRKHTRCSKYMYTHTTFLLRTSIYLTCYSFRLLMESGEKKKPTTITSDQK